MQKDEIDESIMSNNSSSSNANYFYCNTFKDKKSSKYDSFLGWLD